MIVDINQIINEQKECLNTLSNVISNENTNPSKKNLQKAILVSTGLITSILQNRIQTSNVRSVKIKFINDIKEFIEEAQSKFKNAKTKNDEIFIEKLKENLWAYNNVENTLYLSIEYLYSLGIYNIGCGEYIDLLEDCLKTLGYISTKVDDFYDEFAYLEVKVPTIEEKKKIKFNKNLYIFIMISVFVVLMVYLFISSSICVLEWVKTNGKVGITYLLMPIQVIVCYIVIKLSPKLV